MNNKTKPISCIIVDDDAFSRDSLASMLSEFSEIKIIESLEESVLAIKHIAIHKPDIAFLDINMPQKNGISILNEINEIGIDTKVIFVTSYEDYILDALKNNAFDYLIKPVKIQAIDDALQRYCEETKDVVCQGKIDNKQEANNKIVIQNSHGTLIMKPEDIIYIEADGCYTNIYMNNDKVEVISKNLGRVEKLFESNIFFKISRSLIININYLNKIDRLRKLVHLQYMNTKIDLKASKNLLFDLESIIHKS